LNVLEKPPLLVVVGPTASAKTELAVSLAERLGGEIVSSDSVQIYRYFDVGSGKPTAEEKGRARHHLIDICDPLLPLEAKKWAELAEVAILEIRARGKVPIVCGGTYLWVRALLYGLARAPAGDEAIRAQHRRIAEEKGRAELHRRLLLVDEKSAKRLHENDLVRVSRALEVFELGGIPLSVIQEEHGFREPRFQATLLAVQWEREDYEARLAGRVQLMLDAGWMTEVEMLLQRGYGDARAMDAVGYRQVKEAVVGKQAGASVDLGRLREEITRMTRIFARRQRTWLRDETLEWVTAHALGDSAALDQLAHRLSAALA
jgi:tRNA dimethylallyltransferase